MANDATFLDNDATFFVAQVENKEPQTKPISPPEILENVGKFLIEPINHAIAAGVRKALADGVPAHAVIEMHLNHLCSVVAMLEPPQVRAKLMEDVIRAFPQLVAQHVDAKYTTKGGIRLPRGDNLL